MIEDAISEEIIGEEIVQEEVIESSEVVIGEKKEEIISEVENKTPNEEVKKNRIIKTKSSDFGNIVLKPK